VKAWRTRHGAVAVVGQTIDHDRHTTRAHSPRSGFPRSCALELAGGLLDGSLDVVLGHVGRIGLVHGQAQTRIGFGVAAAFARGHRDLTDQAGEDLAALGILRLLAVLDIGPFAVTGHGGWNLLSGWTNV
jgi:hypothetical protein